MTVSVDGQDHYLRQTVPYPLDLPPGRHLIEVWGIRFAPAQSHVPVDATGDTIVAITPEYEKGVTGSTPLGQLRIRKVGSPQDLQPFRFYNDLPIAFGTRTLLPSVLVSVLGCATGLAVGLGLVAMALWGFATRGVAAGVILLPCASIVASIAVPGGLGGLIVAYRFLRLPQDWRVPLEH